MSAFPRSLTPAFLGLALLGFAGCAEDNEAAINKPDATTKVQATDKPPANQEEYFKRQQAQQQKAMSKNEGYPGAK